MATGGCGDVLTGVIASLIGQGLPPFEAAKFGVYVHGLAGDIGADEIGQVSLIATDLLITCPRPFESCECRFSWNGQFRHEIPTI